MREGERSALCARGSPMCERARGQPYVREVALCASGLPFFGKHSKSIPALSKSNALCNTKNGLAMFHKKTADSPMCERTAVFLGNIASPFLRSPRATHCATLRMDLLCFPKKTADV